MKKILLLLFCVASTSLFAQVIEDSTKIKQDSIQLDTLFDKKDTILKENSNKRKKIAEVDTLSYAQEYKRDAVKFQFGLRGGINLGKFKISEVNNVIRVTSTGNPQFPIVKDNFLNNSQAVLGYLGGIFIRLSKGSFYFQPEILYASKSGKFDILQTNGTLFKRVVGNYTAVDVPLTFGIRFRQGRIFAGPMVSYPFRFNQELEDILKVYTASDFKNDLLKRPTFGVNAGIGFDFKHFFIEGRYESMFSNTIDYKIGPANNPVQFQMSPSQFQITIGLVK